MKAFLIGTSEEFTLGMQYTSQSKKLVIGGHIDFNQKMENILVDYFKADYSKIKVNEPAYNKVKFQVDLPFVNFTEGCNKLIEEGIIVKPVKSLERIWW